MRGQDKTANGAKRVARPRPWHSVQGSARCDGAQTPAVPPTAKTFSQQDSGKARFILHLPRPLAEAQTKKFWS